MIKRFSEYMAENHPNRFGPRYTDFQDTEKDLKQAMTVLMSETRKEIGLEDIPLKTEVKNILEESSSYYRAILVRDEGLELFDRVYDNLLKRWG